MAVKVLIPAPMRQHTGGNAAVDAAGGTVREALTNVGYLFPELTERLFEGSALKKFVNVFVNDEDIRYLSNLDTAVKDGDEVNIIPAVAGG
ncbi:MAG: MoaD/ThiS family protein [Gemmataceae bacterium]